MINLKYMAAFLFLLLHSSGAHMALAVVWSRLHALHDPADRETLIERALHQAAGDTTEFATSEDETWVENPRRVDALLSALQQHAGVEIFEAKRHTLEEGPLLVSPH